MPRGDMEATSGDLATWLYKLGNVVEKSLGSGTYAKVKRAHWMKTGKKVAIKIVDRRKAPADVMESRIMLRHQPRIIQLYDVIVNEVVMELAEKGDPLDFISLHWRQSEPVARRLPKDLIEGMSTCHWWGIVRRDLKCQNLLLDKDGCLKIADFGFVRTCESRLLETYCGSFAYAASEIILTKPYDGVMSDVWSMGVILYAMVSGRLLFQDTNVKILMSQIASRIQFPEMESVTSAKTSSFVF